MAAARDAVARETAAEAFVFHQMVAHLRANSPAVQNIEVMNAAGFCRNCLSKWYHKGAAAAGLPCTYDQACERVYGMPYADWKKRFQTKATPEQLEKFKATHGFHAKHEPVQEVADPDPAPHSTASAAAAAAAVAMTTAVAPSSGPVKSDVCCEDPAVGDRSAQAMVQRILDRDKDIRASGAPEVRVRLGVLTVSDRASQGIYADKSGPEVKSCVEAFAAEAPEFQLESVSSMVVPDQVAEVSEALKALCVDCNLVLSTGGTGLSKRDITPEATLAVIDREVRGIPELVRRETSKVEPLAILSRAVAGIRADSSLIINLPGRPKACREALAVLLPCLGHALGQLES